MTGEELEALKAACTDACLEAGQPAPVFPEAGGRLREKWRPCPYCGWSEMRLPDSWYVSTERVIGVSGRCGGCGKHWREFYVFVRAEEVP